jgi:acyl-CoA hydrolase
MWKAVSRVRQDATRAVLRHGGRATTARRNFATADAARAPLRPVKDGCDSRAWLTEVLRPTSLFNMNRVSAGAVLRLIDLVTGIAAVKHAESAGAVTLAFDRVSFVRELRAYDVLRLEAEVVSVGRSSMLVLCEGFQQDLHTGQLTPVMKSHVTYVAMGDDLRPTQVGLAPLGGRCAQATAALLASSSPSRVRVPSRDSFSARESGGLSCCAARV